MAEFHQLDLGQVYAQAGQINAMKEASAFNKLRTLAAQEELAAMPEQRQRAAAQESRAAAQEARAATTHGQEQKLAQLRILNAAAAEIAENPSAASRWMPELQAAGLPAEPMDQESARQVFASTSKALEAFNAGSGVAQAKPSALIEQYNQAVAEGFKGGYLEFVREQAQRQVGAQYGSPVNQPGVGVVQPSRVDPSQNITLAPEPAVNQAAADRANTEAAATVTGKTTAERQIDFPRLQQNVNESIRVIDQLKAHPGLPYITGLYSKAPILPNTDQAAADALAKQIAGRTFLEAYNTLKGGGQITEVEGTKAQEAIGRLSRAQHIDDYTEALDELRSVMSNGLERARKQSVAPQAETGNTASDGASDGLDLQNMSEEELRRLASEP